MKTFREVSTNPYQARSYTIPEWLILFFAIVILMKLPKCHIAEAVFWPVFILASFASVVGSQAVISATFSIISQCSALKCFPRVKIVHTSSKIYGQIYIPEVNWMLMCLCLAVTIGLRDTNMMGHAYGINIVFNL